MTSSRFSNYLRANRKRLTLSQDEVAFLLGAQSGAKVSRYERFAREPSLKTALAYQVICQQPVSELFRGLYEEVESEVSERARQLASIKYSGKASAVAIRKRELLEKLAATRAA